MSSKMDFCIKANPPVPCTPFVLYPEDDFVSSTGSDTIVPRSEDANVDYQSTSNRSLDDNRLPRIPEYHFLGWLYCKMLYKEIIINFSYKECQYLTDFIGADTVRRDWRPETPVFISAQTGAGKNTFIHEILIGELIMEAGNKNDKVLLLCNRVALSRQSKYDAMERKGYTLFGKMDKREDYSLSGFDKHGHEFGPIHIYTYHQLLTNNAIHLENYKYIVCDECHFFTSDARFNGETDKILKKIVSEGNNSIRIYMSATPEVAFEPIIREEFSLVNARKIEAKNIVRNEINTIREKNAFRRPMEQMLNRCFRQSLTPYLLPGENHEDYIERMQNTEKNRMAVHASQKYLDDTSEESLQYRERKACEEIDSYHQLAVHFYYMERNYDYIQDITTYVDDDDLASKIKENVSTNDKWMVFVHSKQYGEKLCDKLNDVSDKTVSKKTPEDKRLAVFISSSNKEEESDSMAAFEEVVKDSKFSQKVLITTSVLDNGINIKDIAVKNIVIGIYDRIEFIQMLGRIRIESSNQKINLYIKEYSVDKLKEFAKNSALNLIRRLRIDSLSPKAKLDEYNHMINTSETKLDKKLYRTYPDGQGISIGYNPYAVYQLIDQLKNLISIIRKTEPDFCIEYDNYDAEERKEEVVDYYTNNIGKYKLWSRSIVDILCSKRDMKNRKKYNVEDIESGYKEWRYIPTLQDTFIHYLYFDLIPSFIQGKIYYEIDHKYFCTLSKERLNGMIGTSKFDKAVTQFKTLYERFKPTLEGSPYPYFKVWEIVYNGFSDDEKEIYSTLMKRTKRLVKKFDNYRKLASDVVDNPTDAQYRWIGKWKEKTKRTTKKTFDRNIMEMITTEDELKQNEKGGRYKKPFLEAHGILRKQKPSREEVAFGKIYLNGTLPRNHLDKEFCIDNTICKIISCNDNTEKHRTYYLPIKKNPPQDITSTNEINQPSENSSNNRDGN